MNMSTLHTVYQAVNLAKLLYAAPACWGFTTIDWNPIAGSLQQSVQTGFFEAGLADITMLVDEAEDELFHSRSLILGDQQYCNKYQLQYLNTLSNTAVQLVFKYCLNTQILMLVFKYILRVFLTTEYDNHSVKKYALSLITATY